MKRVALSGGGERADEQSSLDAGFLPCLRGEREEIDDGVRCHGEDIGDGGIVTAEDREIERCVGARNLLGLRFGCVGWLIVGMTVARCKTRHRARERITERRGMSRTE